MSKLTVQQVQRMTGTSWATLAAQYSTTAQTMCEIAAKARVTGKKFRGYTADHAQSEADDFAARAAECSAQTA